MATSKEIDIFHKDILYKVGKKRSCLRSKKEKHVTGFLAREGSQYKNNRELMVVGRAVNGWGEGICTDNLVEESENYAKEVNNFKPIIGNKDCPMSWVEESFHYSAQSSAFWRTIRKIVGKLGLENDEEKWSSYLVWSNLYKVAPAEGGNPSDKLCDIQLEGCRSLFKTELSIYAPKRLLLLTGLCWAKPFLEYIQFKWKSDDKNHVECYGQYKTSKATAKVVVSCHPQGKNEEEWVEAVLGAFQKIAT